MTNEEIDTYIQINSCARCGGKLYNYWSNCKDLDCCGIEDTIECDGCSLIVYGWTNEELITGYLLTTSKVYHWF